MAYPLGAWAGDKFVFNSPEAEKKWQMDSFMQGSHHQLWMKGRRLRPDENTLAGMGLPPSDDTYLGPDGQHYQTTPASREDPHMTMLRAAHLAAEPAQGNASAMGQRASEKALPQAMAMMAQGGRVEAKPPAVNDNRAAANDNRAANPTASAAAPPSPAAPQPKTVAEHAAYGRSGHMTAEERQTASDDVRLLYSGATAGYGDNAIAALKALGDYADGKEFGASYDAALPVEQRKTEEARSREKIAGALIESLPSFIPGYGDVTGLIADLKMYREHPEERTWQNIALTAAGILPFVPSAASSIKKVEHAVEAVEDGAKTVAKESEEVAQIGKAEGSAKDTAKKADEVPEAGNKTAANVPATGSAEKGTYTKTEPLADVFPELAGVNPHYKENAGPGVNTNCASCAVATQFRLTGKSGAVAEPNRGYAGRNALLPAFPYGLERGKTTPIKVKEELLVRGDGATGLVIVLQESGVAHALNVVNRGGTVYFIDSQLGKIVTLNPHLKVKFGAP